MAQRTWRFTVDLAGSSRTILGVSQVQHDHADQQTDQRADDTRRLKIALALIVAFMACEITVALLASSLALLSDAAHMLTDAAALGLALLAIRLASRPAGGRMTFGLGRAEILSAQANGLTMLVLAAMIVYGGISRLISPPDVEGLPVLLVALLGIAVNLAATWVLGGEHPGHLGHSHDHDAEDGHDGHEHDAPAPRKRSLNMEGSYQHMLTDLFGFIATAIAAAVIMITGFHRADAIASLMIAAIMLHSCWGLLKASALVMMEGAPADLDPEQIGLEMARYPGVSEVHDLHVWEVTSGFPAISAHVVVDCGHDCHQIRLALSQLLEERFRVPHSTLQVEHTQPQQAPMQIEVVSKWT
jgi:cobalt-zinc-cadmium efflux system protein